VTNDYLWDRTGPPDLDIVRLERLLSQLRPVADGPRILLFPSRAVARRPSWSFVVAAASLAAMIVAMIGLSWRANHASAGLDVTRLEGTPTIESRPVSDHLELRAGTWLDTNDQGRASIDIANVGRVDVDPRTRVGLLSSRPGLHRLQLAARHHSRGDLGPARTVRGGHSFIHGRRPGLRIHVDRRR
jgi:hypothetical protein